MNGLYKMFDMGFSAKTAKFFLLKISVVTQYYDLDVPKEFAIRGNAAIMKCQIPSFVADFVSVVSWHTDQNEDFYPSSNPDGNSFKILLTISTRVSTGWFYFPKLDFLFDTLFTVLVVQQFFQTEVNNEYVIRGNSAILKCSIPSFVADFVYAVSWLDSDGHEYSLNENNFGTVAFYLNACKSHKSYDIELGNCVLSLSLHTFNVGSNFIKIFQS